MKENTYDNQTFFEKYSQMERSQKGLDGAGEWQTLKQLLPDFKNKAVLDLGCGYGWHCIYAAEHGAASVIGVDLSEKMLETARSKTSFPQVNYIQAGIEDIDFPENNFDIVLSSLALHYVPSFEKVAAHLHKALKPNGIFIFSVEHPVFTAEGTQQWTYAEDGTILHFPVDNYFYEGKRTAEFLGEEVTKYHKTLTTYIDGLLTNGFQVQRVVEPMPPKHMMTIPGMVDEMRRPMMLIVSAKNIKN
ncbi:class I SAM-dependent methyltransferase [Candidatus Enterococcus clewellii]|uniref:Methyltransferase type 11 domain-containing protein n=1 Tax=Candidatus Enterococcus clewellii TaxID=1834193 RepID=A0AAQ3Y1J8_9ENTE